MKRWHKKEDAGDDVILTMQFGAASKKNVNLDGLIEISTILLIKCCIFMAFYNFIFESLSWGVKE